VQALVPVALTATRARQRGQQPSCGVPPSIELATSPAKQRFSSGSPGKRPSARHVSASPPGDSGQPCPLHVPAALASSPQSHSASRSTQYCSPLKLDCAQNPRGQSSEPMHGSQLSPVPRHEPKRCEHVATPRSSSHMPHSAAVPHGQESARGSQGTVQIFSPLRSRAQICPGTAKQSASLSHGAQNARGKHTERNTPSPPQWY